MRLLLADKFQVQWNQSRSPKVETMQLLTAGKTTAFQFFSKYFFVTSLLCRSDGIDSLAHLSTKLVIKHVPHSHLFELTIRGKWIPTVNKELFLRLLRLEVRGLSGHLAPVHAAGRHLDVLQMHHSLRGTVCLKTGKQRFVNLKT